MDVAYQRGSFLPPAAPLSLLPRETPPLLLGLIIFFGTLTTDGNFTAVLCLTICSASQVVLLLWVILFHRTHKEAEAQRGTTHAHGHTAGELRNVG